MAIRQTVEAVVGKGFPLLLHAAGVFHQTALQGAVGAPLVVVVLDSATVCVDIDQSAAPRIVAAAGDQAVAVDFFLYLAAGVDVTEGFDRCTLMIEDFARVTEVVRAVIVSDTGTVGGGDALQTPLAIVAVAVAVTAAEAGGAELGGDGLQLGAVVVDVAFPEYLGAAADAACL